MASKRKLIVEILGENGKLAQVLADSEAKLTRLSSKLKATGEKLRSAGKKMSIGVTLPIAAVGAAVFALAADVSDAMGATSEIFGSQAKKVKRWAISLKPYYGIAKGAALEYANMMGTMLMNLGGLTKDQAAKTSSSLVELAGDLTAMYGGTTEAAVQALTGALKGNNSMLDNYGIAVTDATLKQRALELGVYDGTGALSQQAKQAATLSLIWEQTSAAQGQAAREAGGASGSLRSVTTQAKNLGAQLGAKLLPIGAKLLGWAGKLMDRFSSLDSKVQTIILVVVGLVAALGPVIYIAGTLATAVGAVTGVLAAMGAAATAAGGGLAGIGAALGVIFSPVVLVVGAVSALVAVFVLLYKHNEGFRKFVDQVVALIKGKLLAAFGWLRVQVPLAWERVRLGAEALWARLRPILSSAADAVVGVARWVTGSLLPAIGRLGATIRTTLSPIVEELAKTWRDLLWPALKLVAEFIAKYVMVQVKVLAWAWANVLAPALRFVADVISQRVWPVLQGIANVLIAVGTVVARVIAQIVATVISIPRRIASTIAHLWDGLVWGVTAARNFVSDRVEDIISVVRGIGSRIAGISDVIKAPFRIAFDAIKSLWNNTLGQFSFSIPDIPGLPGRGKKISFPRMHTGGVVGGIRGSEQATILEAGETVRSARQEASLQAILAGFISAANASPLVHLDLRGAILTDDLAKKILELVEEAIAKGHRAPKLAAALR